MRAVARAMVAAAFLISAGPREAGAFYEWQGDSTSGEMRGFIRLVVAASRNPSNRIIYPNETDSSETAIARFLLLGRAGENIALDFNAFNLLNHNSAAGDIARDQAIAGQPERSPALEIKYTGGRKTEGRVGVDRLNLRLSIGRVDAILGRQPVNLATSFYFTPNDFFAPFAAQTFYRTYKPGVDAARIEVRLGALTQLTLLGVLGYEKDLSTSNGHSGAVSRERSSALVRASTVFHGFEWGLLGGSVKGAGVAGGSLQGEIFGWLGVRAEGHHASLDDGEKDSYTEFTLEFEHRFENSLYIHFAQFHHGSGHEKAEEYSQSLLVDKEIDPYLGRAYSALGASYEYSPLTVSEILAIVNWTDGSYLISFNAIHSIADEAEFSWGFAIPVGAQMEAMDIKSEFGLYPYSINAELRVYF